MPTPEFLRERNRLWARLRGLPEFSPEFEDAVAELAALIGWPRAKILAGLGLHDHEQGADEESAPS